MDKKMANDKLVKTRSEALEIARQSYAASQATALADMLHLMGEQYRKEITAEVTAFWMAALIERARLSPDQIREGFMAHFSNPEKCNWPPQPGDVIGGVPELPQPRDGALKEMAELKKRRDEHPEEFIGLEALVQIAKNLNVNLQTAKPMPNVKTVWPDIDPNKNKAKLDAQAAELLKGKP